MTKQEERAIERALREIDRTLWWLDDLYSTVERQGSEAIERVFLLARDVISDRRQGLMRVTEAVDDLIRRVKDLERTEDDLERDVEELERENETLKEENQDLEEEVRALEEEVRTLKAGQSEGAAQA